MKLDDVPRTVAVASGKGGVGKTTVASDLARAAQERGYTVGLIDADISTPNSPEVVGGEELDMESQRLSTRDAIVPPEVEGIQLVSQGVVLPDDVPVLRDGTWRAEAVADYIGHVEWKDGTDLVVIDTPPGTGEELQVIAAEAPPTHAFVVTTPHPSSVRDATKTHEFFEQAGIPHEAIVNMAYIPKEDIATHAYGGVDFTQVQQVGDARAEEIEALLDGAAEDFPLFGYEGGEELPFDAERAATVPYTPDFEDRSIVYADPIDRIFIDNEVEA